MACARPASVRSTSTHPVKRFSRFHVLWPWRSSTSWYGAVAGLPSLLRHAIVPRGPGARPSRAQNARSPRGDTLSSGSVRSVPDHEIEERRVTGSARPSRRIRRKAIATRVKEATLPVNEAGRFPLDHGAIAG